MKKNIVLAVLVVLVISLSLLSSNLHKEIRRMKTEIGYDYKWVINDARYIVNRMKETNLQEAIQTEHGIQLVDTFRDQAFIEFYSIFQLYLSYFQVSNLFGKVYNIQDKALKQRKVSNEDLEIYKDRLEKLSFILMDLDHYPGSMPELFESFYEEADPEIAEKIKQRLEADY